MGQRGVAVVAALALGAVLCSCDNKPLSRGQIIARMTNTYATCRSYQDIGETVQIATMTLPSGTGLMVQTNRLSFALQFRRPSSVHFEFSHQEMPEAVTPDQIRNRANWPRSKCLLWSDGQQTRLYAEKTRRYWQAADWSDGVAQVNRLGLSGGQSTGATVLDFLTTRQRVGLIQLALQNNTPVREDKFDGSKCYVLSSTISNTAMTFELWIGRKDYLLRKKRMIMNTRIMSGVFDEDHRNVRVNQWLPDRVFKSPVPADARATTNVWSLLPDLERQFAASRKFEAAQRGAQQGPPAFPMARKVIALADLWKGGESPKSPSYLDCFPDKVVIYPGSKTVTWAELQQSGNAVEKLLDRVQANSKDEYVVIMARPQSVKFYRAVRKLVSQRAIDVRYDAVDANFKVDWSEADKSLHLDEPVSQLPPSPMPPVFNPTPRAVVSNKQPVFFECRGNEVFFVDKDGLDRQVAKLLSTLPPDAPGRNVQEFVKQISSKDVGNEQYKVVPSYLLTAIIALEPRLNVQGASVEKLNDPNGPFHAVLAKLNSQTQSITFLLRDDSFDVFRRARKIATEAGFTINWELLGNDEPIKFGSGGAAVN